MISTSRVENESQRLERLEREDRRRRWDSVLQGHVEDPPPGECQTAARDVHASRRAASPEAGSSDAHSLLALLGDRLDRMERLAMRLESEIHQQQRINQARFQRGWIAMFAVAISTAGLLWLLLRLSPP